VRLRPRWLAALLWLYRAKGEDEEAPLNSEDPEGDPADA